MGNLISWISEHFTFQGVGIIAGLCLTAFTIYVDAKVRKVEILFNITQQQRFIWWKMLDMPKLKRIMSKTPDLQKHPITEDEWLYVNSLILHLSAVMFATRQKIFPKPPGQDVDIREFFSLPIPHAVWQDAKKFREISDIKYIESMLNPPKPSILKRTISRIKEWFASFRRI